jgi:hypothetical protein
MASATTGTLPNATIHLKSFEVFHLHDEISPAIVAIKVAFVPTFMGLNIANRNNTSTAFFPCLELACDNDRLLANNVIAATDFTTLSIRFIFSISIDQEWVTQSANQPADQG